MLTLRSDLDSHVPATVTGFLAALFLSVAHLVAISGRDRDPVRGDDMKEGPAEINEW